MKFCHFVAAAAAFAVGQASSAPAQTPVSRSSTVVQSIYSDNHPLALQLPGEVQDKIQKMAADPFSFYRGTASLFYQDMTTLPASAYNTTQTSVAWLCGDMHLANFGVMQDSTGTSVFDVDDADEGYWGPYVWDIRRLATSIILTAQLNGISSSNQQQLVTDFISAYLSNIKDFHGSNDELSFQLSNSDTSGYVNDLIGESKSDSRSSFLAKYTAVSGSARSFMTASDLITVPQGTYNSIVSAVGTYVNSISSGKQFSSSYYQVKDIRQKLDSGIGSLGKYRYWVLIQGPSSSTGDDVILEMKQEQSSAVAIAAPGNFPAADYGNNEGQRVALTVKATHINTDVLVGWTTMNGMAFYIHEKSPYEEDFDDTQLTSFGKFDTAVAYMGMALAADHSRADQDYNPNLIPYSMDKQIDDAVTSKSGFTSEIIAFATNYAAQVQLDYASFVTAYDNGTPLY